MFYLLGFFLSVSVACGPGTYGFLFYSPDEGVGKKAYGSLSVYQREENIYDHSEISDEQYRQNVQGHLGILRPHSPFFLYGLRIAI